MSEERQTEIVMPEAEALKFVTPVMKMSDADDRTPLGTYPQNAALSIAKLIARRYSFKPIVLVIHDKKWDTYFWSFYAPGRRVGVVRGAEMRAYVKGVWDGMCS